MRCCSPKRVEHFRRSLGQADDAARTLRHG
jgi:hypothetical protein